MLTTTPGGGSRYRLPKHVRDSVNWVYLLPATFFFAAYMVYPLIRVFYISLTDYQYLSNEPANFTGLENYTTALSDPVFLRGIWRSVIFTAIFLPGTIFFPLLIAILVDRVQHPRVATLYRIILLIPIAIPGPMVFVLWRWLYDFNIGPINTILIDHLSLFDSTNAPQWLGDTDLALPAVAFMEWWWGLGYHTMFFLAGLAIIPKDLNEAARIDGANEWQLFWHVTLPRLRPMFVVMVVLRLGTSMAVIDEFLIMGGLNRALPTYSWTVYMWHLSFQLGNWPQGYAAAIGWIGAFAMLIVVAFLFYIFRDKDKK